jgi:putative membrane-bound dehydrogenase-like protein
MKYRWRSTVALGALGLAGVIGAQSPSVAPVTRGFDLDPRLESEVWCAEPQVVDPVGLAFAADGVAYVAECRDYPYGAGASGRPGSTVRRLADTDGDGLPDRSTVFASDLSYATSVLPWRDGVLALAPPEIVFLQDTDGDGRADRRTVVLRGLGLGVSDSLANSLRYHLDGRVHVANGGNGGRLTSPLREGLSVALGDHDFAFDPDTGEVELTARTGGGFGLVFDAWGRGFTTYNIDHIQHRFLPLAHARRNPGFPAVAITGSISDHGDMAQIFPISEPETRPNHPEQAGHFSAAGGMGLCESPIFPRDLQGSVFVCDVVGHLVHRDVIRPDGPVFRASRAFEDSDREFLASRDPSFRPVGLETGPDGALYLLDMQREVIEHPDYIPQKVRASLDLRAGQDRGRIHRITPRGGAPRRFPRLSAMTPAQWVRHLGDPNPWVRGTAQRLLHERQARETAPALRRLATSKVRPEGRLHALATLRVLGVLQPADLMTALADPHPGVRENALRWSEPWLASEARLQARVLELSRDALPRIRFQAAQSLAVVGTPDSVDALAALYWRDASSPWTRRAVLGSLRPGEAGLVLRRLAGPSPQVGTVVDASLAAALQDLAESVAVQATSAPGDFAVSLELLEALQGVPALRGALLEGLESGLARSGKVPPIAPAALRAVTVLAARPAAPEWISALRLMRRLQAPSDPGVNQALAESFQMATNAALPVAVRLPRLRAMELAEAPATWLEGLSRLLGAPHEEAEIQTAAFDVLERLQPPRLGRWLVDRWPGLPPALRGRAGRLLAERRALHGDLLEAVESGAIRVGELNLDLEQRRRLLRGGSVEIRARAARFWSDEEYSNRSKLVDEWLAKLPAGGDAYRGRKVFESSCAHCHRMGEVGMRVGPELAGSAHRSVEDLLSNILDPNMAMNPAFVAYQAETVDDETITGLLEAQRGDSVTLRQAGEQRVVLPRTRIRSLRSTGLSLMPEGLEAGRSPQELRDLIAFIRGEAAVRPVDSAGGAR